MLEGEKSKSTMVAVDVTMKLSMSSVGDVSSGSAATSTTVGYLAPIQQQPSGKPRHIRDELDPAPHHTAADIRVLEILKRIRDSGGVGDEDLDTPPPKRKSCRTKVDRTSFTRQTPPPVLPQQQSVTAAPSARIPINHFNVPISNRLDGIHIRPATTVTIPSQLINGVPSSSILLASKNGTASPLTSGLTADCGGVKAAVALLRQKPPMAPPAAAAAAQQTAIGLELILPNGLRIPVSAKCSKSDVQMKSTTTVAAVASTGAVNKLVSIPPPVSSTMTTVNASQQMCSCSRSKCLKLYCDCFAAGKACGDGCNCRHCYNNLADDISKHTRDVAVRTALSRNSLAFKPKIENMGKHVLGCRCKRSHCLKGYRECYLQQATAAATASAAIAAGSGSGSTTTATIDSADATTIATTSSIASAFTTPRTITLKVPIKALTPVNGSGSSVAPQVTVPADLPPFLHQSYLAAAASATKDACLSQDLLKYLRTVLPPIQPRPQPHPHTPVELQTPQFDVQTSMTIGKSADTSVMKAAAVSPSKSSPPPSLLAKGDILENPSAVTHVAAALTPEASPPGELLDDRGNQHGFSVCVEEEEEQREEVEEDDDYSGYTDEELAFMQRLQQDRSTIAAPATDIYQCPDTAASAAACVTASLSAASTLAPIKPMLQEPRPEESVHIPPHSAPPSLCPDLAEKLADGRCTSVEVHFMRRKIDELETQVSQLTQLIHTQGEMLGNLADLLLSQQQRPQ